MEISVALQKEFWMCCFVHKPRSLQGYEGAGKGKEDGAGVLVIVTGFLTAPSLGLHSLGSGMFSSLMGAGKCL